MKPQQTETNLSENQSLNPKTVALLLALLVAGGCGRPSSAKSNAVVDSEANIETSNLSTDDPEVSKILARLREQVKQTETNEKPKLEGDGPDPKSLSKAIKVSTGSIGVLGLTNERLQEILLIGASNGIDAAVAGSVFALLKKAKYLVGFVAGVGVTHWGFPKFASWGLNHAGDGNLAIGAISGVGGILLGKMALGILNEASEIKGSQEEVQQIEPELERKGIARVINTLKNTAATIIKPFKIKNPFALGALASFPVAVDILVTGAAIEGYNWPQSDLQIAFPAIGIICAAMAAGAIVGSRFFINRGIDKEVENNKNTKTLGEIRRTEEFRNSSRHFAKWRSRSAWAGATAFAWLSLKSFLSSAQALNAKAAEVISAIPINTDLLTTATAAGLLYLYGKSKGFPSEIGKAQLKESRGDIMERVVASKKTTA